MVTFQWYGGSSYATPIDGKDVEHATSLARVKRIVAARLDNEDGRTPCVEYYEPGARAALVWKGDLDDTTDVYPDWEITIGPRGGINVERC